MKIWIKRKISNTKYFFSKFNWLKVYNSPFKVPIPKFYTGKVEFGVPIFFPRRWSDRKNQWIRKKIGFDFVRLGYKTKWSNTDIRFEWGPIWSFVCFGLQIAIIFKVPHLDHYWECWVIYSQHTDKDKSRKERLIQAKELFPCVWIQRNKDGNNIRTCYWNLILKKKYLK